MVGLGCRLGAKRRSKESRGQRSDDRVAAASQLPAESGARCGRDPGRVLRVTADERVVGIDLGTTNSLVAFMQGEKPAVIPGEEGLKLVPSVVALAPARDGGRPAMLVGNGARHTLLHAPEQAIYSVKRLMGRGVEDVVEELKFFPFRLADGIQPGEVLRIRLGDSEFTPPEISAHILRQLTRNAA